MENTEYRNVSERWDDEHTDAHGYPRKVYESSYFDDSDDKKAHAYNAHGIFWKDGHFKHVSVRSTGYGRYVYEDTYEEDVVMSYDILYDSDLKKILKEGETIKVPVLSGEKKGAVVRLGLVHSKLVETDDFIAVGKFLFEPGSDNKILTGYLRANNENDTDLVIPDSTEIIADEAFKDLRSIKSVTIPNSVKSIGRSAFEDCSAIETLLVRDSVKKICEGTFSQCKNLIKNLITVHIPNSVTSIGDSAFECCRALKSVTIPKGVTSIGDSAFQSCFSLTSVTIHEGVTSIGNKAFFLCASLETIDLPDSITKIGEGAFAHCSSLKRIKIPKGVNYLPYFEGCRNLKTVMISRPLFDKYKSRFYDDTEFVFY